ncbi:MAG: hypothetical protein G8345_06370 [Magnetococcales bacterium]|nr:hypothetical protein [Magnetococcales bacterium]NGZ26495.1 hypothetical protein [Magnetococcales bacterium]
MGQSRVLWSATLVVCSPVYGMVASATTAMDALSTTTTASSASSSWMAGR